jgi:hypothetical protein
VVGGLFIKLLADPVIWKKWASRDKQTVGNWAALPSRPVITEIVPTSRARPVLWRYTTTATPPPAGWFQVEFDDSAWKQGSGGFGSFGTPGAVVRTQWTDTPGDIWIRRTFTFPDGKIPTGLQLYLHHDEAAEIYINGVLAGSETGFSTNYDLLELSDAARAALKPMGANTLAVHCHQTTGGQYIDVGLATEK